MVKGDNDSQQSRSLPPRTYYDAEHKDGYCTICDLNWKLEKQIMYTTQNKKRTYGICPKCKDKRPLRKSPRTRDAYLKQFPPKRVE